MGGNKDDRLQCGGHIFFRKELLLEIVTMKTVDWRKDQEVEL